MKESKLAHISDVIAKLQELMAEHGDAPVHVWDPYHDASDVLLVEHVQWDRVDGVVGIYNFSLS